MATAKVKKEETKKEKFGQLEWTNAEGMRIPLYKMKRAHLESVKKLLFRAKQEIWNNLHKSTWLLEIDRVLDWRAQKYEEFLKRKTSSSSELGKILNSIDITLEKEEKSRRDKGIENTLEE